jgi:hypothetical protein
MSRKNVMVNGGTLGFAVGSVVSGGAFTITAVPSVRTKVDGKGIYCGPLAWTFAGGNATGAVNGTVFGAGTINPSAVYNKDGGLAMVLEGDSVAATFNGVTPNGNPITFPGVTVRVANAGQTKVLGD